MSRDQAFRVLIVHLADGRGEVIDRTEARPHTTNFPFIRIGNKQCVLKIDFDEWPFEW